MRVIEKFYLFFTPANQDDHKKDKPSPKSVSFHSKNVSIVYDR